ncbi:AAA family ATPase [Thalassoglobus sp.]|uniref:AAA family ATPase n=1 Tax=Thalassoglobus sp. TaxID=2795869 RepID=UPI003AA81666
MKALLVSDNIWVTSKLQTLLNNSKLLESCVHLQRPHNITAQQSTEGDFNVLFLVLSDDLECAKGDLSFLKLALHTYVVAVGAVASPEVMIELLHSGADDFLNTERDLEDQLEKILKNLKTRHGITQKPSNVISILGASGGVGTSSVAVNIATLIAETSQTGLIDLVLEGGDLDKLLGLKPTHTIRELCQNSSGIDHNLIERSVVNHSSGVSLLAAGNSSGNAPAVDIEMIHQFTDLCRELFKNLVFDLGSPRQVGNHPKLLEQSKLILLLFRPDFPSICNARQQLEQIESMGTGQEKVIPVANFQGMPIQIPIDKAEVMLGRKVQFAIPYDPSLMNLCANCGVPAVLESPKSKFTRSLKTIVEKFSEEKSPPASAPEESSKSGLSKIASKSMSFLKYSVRTFCL